MLTPQEIQEVKFEKAVFGGYDMAQIDKFLDELLADYSLLYKEAWRGAPADPERHPGCRNPRVLQRCGIPRRR